MCLSALLSRTKNCSLASNGARSWCVTERSDLGSPFGRAGCPVRGSLRGSHVPIYAFNHQTEYPLSQPVRLTALPKGEPRALSRQCDKLQFAAMLSQTDMHILYYVPLFVCDYPDLENPDLDKPPAENPHTVKTTCGKP